jgi:hypothetical protein
MKRLFTLILLAISSVNALHFFLEGSQEKCFVEELPIETTVVGGTSTPNFPSVKKNVTPN